MTGLPPAYAGWLLETGSLTARLRARTPRFGVRLLRQGRAPVSPPERRLLGGAVLPVAREVLLLAEGRPVIYARTLMPPRLLRGEWAVLGRLGERPLGELLFENDKDLRTTMHLLHLGPCDLLYRRAAAHLASSPARLWARASTFRLCGQDLLVTEVFLPGILEM